MTDRELMQQALEAMGTVGADWICEASHHAKKDQHQWGEICPLQQRWHIAFQALRERLAQPEQEPVAWTGVDFAIDCTPPRREWVGLTDEEIKALPQWFPSHETAAVMPLIRAIEAKLKEKNS